MSELIYWFFIYILALIFFITGVFKLLDFLKKRKSSMNSTNFTNLSKYSQDRVSYSSSGSNSFSKIFKIFRFMFFYPFLLFTLANIVINYNLIEFQIPVITSESGDFNFRINHNLNDFSYDLIIQNNGLEETNFEIGLECIKQDDNCQDISNLFLYDENLKIGSKFRIELPIVLILENKSFYSDKYYIQIKNTLTNESEKMILKIN
jgi:hypothetical protein